MAPREGEKIEERRLVDPLELEILVNVLISCLENDSKVMEPLWDETVRLWAMTLATEMGEDWVWITTLLARSMESMKTGTLKELISRLPMLEGREVVTSITRRGAMGYESRERPPVEMEM
jgi:hypothetical protein